MSEPSDYPKAAIEAALAEWFSESPGYDWSELHDDMARTIAAFERAMWVPVEEAQRDVPLLVTDKGFEPGMTTAAWFPEQNRFAAYDEAIDGCWDNQGMDVSPMARPLPSGPEGAPDAQEQREAAEPDQIVLTDDDPRIYDAGFIVAHSSDEDGLPDVGLSVGLGGGWMLFAGDMPDHQDQALALYGQNDKLMVAEAVEREAADDMLTFIARAIIEARAEGHRAGYAAGIEAAEAEALKVLGTARATAISCEPGTPSDQYLVGEATGARSIAAAIRALPIPEGGAE